MDRRAQHTRPPEDTNSPPRKRSRDQARRTSGDQGTAAYPEAVNRLISELSSLPGVGRRSAERLAFHVLKSSPDEAARLSRAIDDVKSSVRHCSICYNLTHDDPCPICAAPQRDRARVLVVEQPKDLIIIEQTRMFTGLYHVLMGRISPLEGIGPDALTIAALLHRLDHPQDLPGGVAVGEVILGLNPTLEGDGTALYISEQCAKRGVQISRLARGLPSGAPLEYASRAVLADAILGRQDVRPAPTQPAQHQPVNPIPD